MIELSRLEELLSRMQQRRIGVLGDFCLDAYWLLDETQQELSLESGKMTRAVKKQAYGLGGAGNVVSNLVDLGVGSISAFGVIGPELFGREMVGQLTDKSVDVTGLIVQDDGWDTPVYAKPYIGHEEQERIDFGRSNRIDPETESELIQSLEAALPELDGLIINQQLSRTFYTQHVIDELNRLATKFDDTIIVVDSRDYCDKFRNIILKLNAGEAAVVCGGRRDAAQAEDIDELKEYCREMQQRFDSEIIVTRSNRGALCFDGREFTEVPGIQILKQIDPVGAGDTMVAALTAALTAGATSAEAAHLANYAAAVSVQKILQTGTASPKEILDQAAESDFVFRPELARDVRRSRYLDGTEIEIVNDDVEWGRIRHVIFDHDGTISTLRQGWEQIIEPVMVRAILGRQHDSASEKLYRRVVDRVREYIDQSTGVDTIVQMQMLVSMVKEFNIVPQEDVLDAMGYKQIYNEALMAAVNKRINKLRNDELQVVDYTIKGALDLLRELDVRGVKLYMASGTDRHDVINEAKLLGYAGYFEGIYGWAGDPTKSAKRMVVDQIIAENKLEGPQLACFGDGPVELRETKKHGGIAIGVASDEVRRYGLNVRKRTRLIHAGADIVIPDYSQLPQLMALMFPNG